jgi:hypothetical protein
MKLSDDSYSMAAKERMGIELEGLVGRLNEVGSALAVLNLFRRADIEVEGKNAGYAILSKLISAPTRWLVLLK